MKVLEESEQRERIDTSCFFLFTLHLSAPPFSLREAVRGKMTFPRLRRIILGFSFSQCVPPEADGSVHRGPPSGSSERQREASCGDEGVEK